MIYLSKINLFCQYLKLIIKLKTKIRLLFIFYFFFPQQIDAESVPFSKCCNAPVYIELYESGTGRILCNDKGCQANLLTEFVINFEEDQDLWKERRVFIANQQQDKLVRRQVSKLITTGYFKYNSIVKEVRKLQKSTTPRLQQLNDFYPLSTQNQDNINNQGQNPFITAQQDEGFQTYFGQKGLNQFNALPEFQDFQFQNGDQQNQNIGNQAQSKNNLQTIKQEEQHPQPIQKYKIDQGELISLNQKIANGLVQNSQVFNKEFKYNKNNLLHSSQNRWRPQSTSNIDTNEIQYRSINSQAPNIRLKSGFNKEKKSKNQRQQQQHESEIQKEQEEENTLLDIKNMINEMLS